MPTSTTSSVGECKIKIGIFGLGYVGLPLSIEFGKKYPTLGFDINKGRIDELKKGIDHTNEASPEQLKSANQLTFSANINDIKECNVYIVTVPTPIDEFKTPDLPILINTSVNNINGHFNDSDTKIDPSNNITLIKFVNKSLYNQHKKVVKGVGTCSTVVAVPQLIKARKQTAKRVWRVLLDSGSDGDC